MEETAENCADSTWQDAVIYCERLWVPWYWWVIGFGVCTIMSAQIMFNRNVWWFVGPEIIFCALTAWYLTWLSSTTITVSCDSDGTRWLSIGEATVPQDVVSRALAVPESARRNAMGRQLDPAAYVVSHAWIGEMVMLVIDDPEDPTPYWLLSAKDPESLLRAFVPDLADKAVRTLYM